MNSLCFQNKTTWLKICSNKIEKVNVEYLFSKVVIMSKNTPESWSRPESVNLPSELRISKFAEARVKEIIALSEFIGKQTIPIAK
jgi:hypothetical protein